MFPTPTLLVPALYCTYCSLLFQLLSVEISTVENRPQTGGYAIQQYTPPSQISQYVPHNRQISQFGDAIYMMPGKRYHVPCKRRERYSSTRYLSTPPRACSFTFAENNNQNTRGTKYQNITPGAAGAYETSTVVPGT